MKKHTKKRGPKLSTRLSRFSRKAEIESREHIKENLIDRASHIKNIRLLILEWGLLIFALIMLAVTQTIWFNNSHSLTSYTNGGTYTEGTLGKVNSLNPLFATTSSEKVLSKLLFATLLSVDYSGNPGPSLASSVDISENGKVWIIKLREGLKWSDGEPITNEDVLFTTGLIQNPAVSSVYSSNLTNVKVSETEDKRISFTLPTAYADFDTALYIPILPKHILGDVPAKTLLEHSFSSKPVSSGAFMFNAVQTISNEGEKVIYLSANPHYYKGKPLLNSFAVHSYLTRDELLSDLNRRSLSATAELSPADNQQVNKSIFYEKQTLVNSGVYAFLNTSSEVLKNKSIRKAIQTGINLEKIRSATGDDPALNYPLLSSQITLNNYPSIPDYSPDSAKATIYNYNESLGTTTTLKIATINSGYMPAVANLFADELKSIGFSTELSVYEENQDFFSSVISTRNYDILIYSIELGSDPDLTAYYHSSRASSSGLNFSDYKNTLVDDIILGARETTNLDLRIAKYESFLKYWVDDVPAIGIYQPNISYYYNKNVRTFSNDNHLITAIDRFADVEDWAVTKVQKNRTP